MKIIILLLTSFCYSQTYTVTNGILKIKYANAPYGNFSANESYVKSNKKFGYWQTNCKQTYLDLIEKLTSYGNLPNRVRGYNDRIDGLEIITDERFSFILLINNTFETCKLTKDKALILANELNLLVNQMNDCN